MLYITHLAKPPHSGVLQDFNQLHVRATL